MIETEGHLTILMGRVQVEDGHKWFRAGEMGDGWFIQIVYMDADVDTGLPEEQHGRKWYISKHATDSEVFQTMLAATLASAEHEVRERFQVDGQAIYGPHMNAEVLLAIAGAEDGVKIFTGYTEKEGGLPVTDARQHLAL